MTSHTARLYALLAAVLVFFVAWAAVAAHPWRSDSATADPRLVALQLREQRLRAESVAVKRIVDRRWALYRLQLARRTRRIAEIKARNARTGALLASASPTAAAPRVRIVTLPPLTVTRTS